MEYLLKLKINLILKFLVIAVLIGGCATVHKPLDPALTNQTYNMNVITMIPKGEISIYLWKTNPGGLMGGLLWMAVDAVRDSRAQKRIVPLLEATANVDFRAQYWNELEKPLAGSPWLKIKHLDKRTVAYTKEEADELKPPLLILKTFYALSADSQILFVQTQAILWLKDVKKSDYFAVFMYNSDKVGKNNEDDEKAIALWAANNAELYRKALAEGIEQNIYMLQLDLLGNLSNPKAESDEKTRIHFYEPNIGGMLKVNGHILSRANNRILMRIESGNLVSVPSGFEK